MASACFTPAQHCLSRAEHDLLARIWTAPLTILGIHVGLLQGLSSRQAAILAGEQYRRAHTYRAAHAWRLKQGDTFPTLAPLPQR